MSNNNNRTKSLRVVPVFEVDSLGNIRVTRSRSARKVSLKLADARRRAAKSR